MEDKDIFRGIDRVEWKHSPPALLQRGDQMGFVHYDMAWIQLNCIEPRQHELAVISLTTHPSRLGNILETYHWIENLKVPMLRKIALCAMWGATGQQEVASVVELLNRVGSAKMARGFWQ